MSKSATNETVEEGCWGNKLRRKANLGSTILNLQLLSEKHSEAVWRTRTMRNNTGKLACSCEDNARRSRRLSPSEELTDRQQWELVIWSWLSDGELTIVLEAMGIAPLSNLETAVQETLSQVEGLLVVWAFEVVLCAGRSFRGKWLSDLCCDSVAGGFEIVCVPVNG